MTSEWSQANSCSADALNHDHKWLKTAQFSLSTLIWLIPEWISVCDGGKGRFIMDVGQRKEKDADSDWSPLAWIEGG